MTNEYRIMTQQRNGANVQQHIPCRLYPVNIPIEMQAQGLIPVDLYDLYTDFVTLTVQRTDYFIDEVTNAKYSVFGNPRTYVNHISCRVSKPTGATP